MATILVSVGFGAVFGSVCTIVYHRVKKLKKSKKSPKLNCGLASSELTGKRLVCLCNNPVLSKMLSNRLARHTVDPKSDQKNYFCKIHNLNSKTDESSLLPEASLLLEDRINNANNELDLINENHYDQEFMNKCRDPVFLETQLKKIEDDYEEKMEKLKRIRVKEIAKNEAQYNKIKTEILNENVLQSVGLLDRY